MSGVASVTVTGDQRLLNEYNHKKFQEYMKSLEPFCLRCQHSKRDHYQWKSKYCLGCHDNCNSMYE